MFFYFFRYFFRYFFCTRKRFFLFVLNDISYFCMYVLFLLYTYVIFTVFDFQAVFTARKIAKFLFLLCKNATCGIREYTNENSIIALYTLDILCGMGVSNF